MTHSGPDRLTELVNDERARRAYAEKELAQQRRETIRWRKRARLAEAAAKFSIRLPSLGARPRQAFVPLPAPRIVFPSIRAGISAAPSWISEAVDTVHLSDVDEASLTGLDLLIVGGDEAPPLLVDWLRQPTRQPLIVFSPSGNLAELLRETTIDVIVGETTLTARHIVATALPARATQPSSEMRREDVRQRIVGVRKRTVRQVAASLLRMAGIDPPDKAISVTAIAMTKRPNRVGSLVETLKQMDVEGMEAAVGTHGFTVEPADRDTAESHFGSRVTFSEMPEAFPLGRCLNHLLDETTTEAWAKIDDDDHYGPFYLEEALLELETTGADMVGKLTHYLHDSRPDKTYLLHTGNEYRYIRYVPGPTFVGRRHTWEEVRFPHRHARVDSTFIRGMNALGLTIYSTSRFEFAYGRGDDEHTWQVDESYYAAKGRFVGEGLPREIVFLEDPGAG